MKTLNWQIRTFSNVFLQLIGTLLLIFLPVPCGPLRRHLVGKVTNNQSLEFYSHPKFVCVIHLIWVGWLLTAVGIYNGCALVKGWWLIPSLPFSWAWLTALLLTVAVLGLCFGRVACGFLIASVTIFVLLITLIELKAKIPIVGGLLLGMSRIPIEVPWGVPATVSFVLGVIFSGVVTWQRLNDRWILPAFGNYIEHINFQDKDRSISRGAKNFVAVYNCLIRRYLFFGYGDIEVHSSVGGRLIDKIEGVFFAASHAEAIKRRLATDITMEADEEVLEEEDADEHEALAY